MTPRPRGHDGDPDGSGPTRPHGTAGGGGGGVRSDEAMASAFSQAGRAGNGPVSTPSDIANGQPQHLTTHPTGAAGGAPTGKPKEITVGPDITNQRSDEMENSGARALAASGYRVHQSPSVEEVAEARANTGDTGNPKRRPDYLIEGRVFDCYSPTNPHKPPRGIWDEVVDKVVIRKQTQRVVVNLEDWRGDLNALQRQFDDWPIPGHKELKVITPESEIIQIDLPRPSDRE
jgi:hypothetical protein